MTEGDRVEELAATITALGEALAGHGEWLAALAQGLDDVRQGHGQQLADLAGWMNSAVLTLGSLTSSAVLPSPELTKAAPAAQLVDPVADVAQQLQVWTVMRWLELAPPPPPTPISVVLPTRDRADLLPAAIASVLIQKHPHLELVVVDDGSVDDTPAVLDAVTDPRVRRVRTEGVGHAAARNAGLDHASHSIIAYVDDDNRMDPGWLNAVAWAFDRWPATGMLYGARLVEDAPALESTPSGAMPNLEFVPFDRRRLEQANYIDMNVIAHRADLPGARFDETILAGVDWDLALRLTATVEPLRLPAIACAYGTYAPHRICDRPERLEHTKRVRARVHRNRPMRVLAHNAMFPLLSETYILEESLALEANGAVVAFDAAQAPVSPADVGRAHTLDLAAAVADFDPDVLVLHWLTHALGQLPQLERLGRPFAVRAHSFDADLDEMARLRDHPLCIGVWAYPGHAAQVPGVHPFVPLFPTHEALGAPPAGSPRDLVLSVSAGLPKKDWPTLFEALRLVDDLPRSVVLARSNGLEWVPGHVEQLAAASARPPAVEVNLPRAEVFERLRRASVVLYTVEDGTRLGYPMSLIEALRSGACVVHPDREELRAVVGPGFRGYRTAADIAEHVRAIVAGGPAIEAERAANVAFALERYCDPAAGERYHGELLDALEEWRLRHG